MGYHATFKRPTSLMPNPLLASRGSSCQGGAKLLCTVVGDEAKFDPIPDFDSLAMVGNSSGRSYGASSARGHNCATFDVGGASCAARAPAPCLYRGSSIVCLRPTGMSLNSSLRKPLVASLINAKGQEVVSPGRDEMSSSPATLAHTACCAADEHLLPHEGSMIIQ